MTINLIIEPKLKDPHVLLGTHSISGLNRGDDSRLQVHGQLLAEANPLLIKEKHEEEECRGRGGETGGRKSEKKTES